MSNNQGQPFPLPPEIGAVGQDETSFDNSAHPPIHLLNQALTPAEFCSVFEADKAEAEVYRIIFDAETGSRGAPLVRKTDLTLYRKEAEGRHKVGMVFSSSTILQEGWLRHAPQHVRCKHSSPKSAEDDIRAFALDGIGELEFEVEDCLSGLGQMPLVALLSAMEAACIGRPSTYAVTLKKLFEKKSAIEFDQASRTVRLTPVGAELGAKLETRYADLSSVEFAITFERKLNSVAEGKIAPSEFLSWVLALTHSRDEFAEAVAKKLWSSADELRAYAVSDLTEFGEEGGYISHPISERDCSE